MCHERDTPGSYLRVVVGSYFHADIILYEQALSLGDNGYAILKALIFSLIFISTWNTYQQTPYFFFCNNM